jgi:Protein of unknown function (DUF3048) N-terminal domain/Protein of unknown function (DUF3048) C-terminal domain
VALTPRGKGLIAGVAALAIIGGGALVMTGNAGPVNTLAEKVGLKEPEPDPCPLTGVQAGKGQDPPSRAVLAVKVENSPDARPQVGLDHADVIYEEPVEGGVTRFIVLFQCHDAARLGPVRSARMTDISVLAQYGTPLFGYAGGAPRVRNAVAKADVVDVNYVDAAAEYTRDESREAPHNLYTTTKKLYKAGGSKSSAAPGPVFTYSDELDLKSKPAKSIHIPFSLTYADVNWVWSGADGRWLRSHGTEEHVLEDGDQVSTVNVVAMQVKVSDSDIVDVAGYASPEVTLVGSGKAWVFRNGRVIAGRWVRDAEGDITRFENKAGDEIPLAPGPTWIELVPTAVPVEYSAKP